MLIYEKKLKKPIREVIKAEAQGQADDEEEKVRQVDYNAVEKYIPDWIQEKI